MAAPAIVPPGNTASVGRWRSWLTLVLVALLVLGTAYLIKRPTAAPAASAESDTTVGVVRVGSVAPDFVTTDLAGHRVQLTAYRGHPVWLTFGASWCAGCRTETPDIQTAFQRAQRTGVRVLAVYMGQNSAAVKPYAARLGLTYTQIPDPQSTVTDRYRVRGVPIHYFLSSTGVVKQIEPGVLNLQAMSDALARLS